MLLYIKGKCGKDVKDRIRTVFLHFLISQNLRLQCLQYSYREERSMGILSLMTVLVQYYLSTECLPKPRYYGNCRYYKM